MDKLGIIGDITTVLAHLDGYCPMLAAFDWPSMPGPACATGAYALPLSIAVDAAPAGSVSALLARCARAGSNGRE